jgi:anion-transporting  ArsA/GET3 family ATPase
MAKGDASVLLGTRVLFLTGKGGTGKTTVAAAIGTLLAAQGRRTLVVELDNQRPSLTGIFGTRPVYQPTVVRPGLSIANIEWTSALDDWIADVVSMPRIVRLITHNRMVSLFLEATPGARDLMVLMRVLRLSTQFDHVVVDMPASGNAVAMLSVAITAKRLFDAGPIRRCAEELLTLYRAPDTRVVLVALPEEMVVTETVETAAKITAEVPGLSVPLVLLNRSTPPTLTEPERALIDALGAEHLPGLAGEVVGAGRWEEGLEEATRAALARLAETLPAQVLALPVLARGEGAARVVGQLAAALARASKARVHLTGDVS